MDSLLFEKRTDSCASEMNLNSVKVNMFAFCAVNEISRETGLTSSEVANRMIMFAYEHSKLVEKEVKKRR